MPEARQKERDRLEYVSAMLGELRRMTDLERHATLTYLIEMAWLEARDMVDNDNGSPRGGDERDAVA